ncbi:MAG: permease prefix domain 1-containing protein [Coriobacteriales bacterium]|jgi:hypothetical protein|nr:permease prefix domain 1-containing protein [Coriobacteriales bacterium]
MNVRATDGQAMDTQGYIDTLFHEYQETPALTDFKEEIKAHLDERIRILGQKGMDEKDAAEKALDELGDMSAVADEISRKKKQEVLSEMYMSTRNYITARRGALYALCGLVLGVAVMVSLLAWFGSEYLSAPPAVFMVLGMPALLGFLFLGLTQETASREAMGWKRALWYVLAAGALLAGALTALVAWLDMTETGFGTATLSFPNPSLTAAIAVLMVFALPGIALGAFLVLTEKNRSKPWVVRQREEYRDAQGELFGSAAQEQRFGLVCGALWIAAIAGFIALTMLAGIRFSWLVIAVALVLQMIVMASFVKAK